MKQRRRTGTRKRVYLIVSGGVVHTSYGVVGPCRRGYEATRRFNAFTKSENVEVGGKEASVDERGVEGVARVDGY